MSINKLTHRIRSHFNQPAPVRHLAPLGDRDVDRWVVEGLSAFGCSDRNFKTGVLTGALLPWLFTLFSIMYGWINNWFAPASSRASYGPGRLWELAIVYGGRVAVGTLLLAALGGLFALLRRKLLRLRLQAERSDLPVIARVLSDSRLAATVMGWGLYISWALWPRAEGTLTMSGALHHPWVWLFFGVLFSGYLHWVHNILLYRFYFRDWSVGVVAVVHRFMEGPLHMTLSGKVEADAQTGHVVIRGFPKGQGADRLTDLVYRIPGVEHVRIEEVGAERLPQREVMTLHVPDLDRNRLPLITLARVLFAIFGLSGLAVYAVGLSYALSQGKFLLWSNLIVVLAIQVQVVGLALGYALRRVLVRRAQKDLPQQLHRVLHFIGKDIESFSFGRTWEEARVAVDVTRSEAREHLLPVAARFGLKRLLVDAPFVRR